MAKKVFKGWVSKDYGLDDFAGFDSESDQLELIYVYRTKGEKSDWGESDWPPVRVTITVEVED